MSAALWTILAAGLLPYITVVIAKRGGSGYNNRRPREWAGKLEGFRQRAYAAHQNHFEFFPFFAIAVLIADMETGASRTVMWLAVTIVGLRIAYTLAYFYDRHALRSLLWALGILGVIALFVLAAIGK